MEQGITLMDKLAYIRNLMRQLDDLEHRQRILSSIKENIQNAEKINLEGKVIINHMALSLNEMGELSVPEILNPLKFVLRQYIDFLIQKNEELQKKLLSSIEIVHLDQFDETNTSQASESFNNNSVEAKASKTNSEDKLDSTISSLREIEKDTRKQNMRKLIAEEFYRYAKGSYIDPLEVQRRLKIKTGKLIEMNEIHDLAWILISQDVLKVNYRIACLNNHEAFQDYIEPPLPRKIVCPICKSKIQKVDVCYQKILE